MNVDLESISRIRVRNNDNWMAIVELALKYAPAEEINPLIESIATHDAAVNRLWWKLRK
jgi:hypothetical protein